MQTHKHLNILQLMAAMQKSFAQSLCVCVGNVCVGGGGRIDGKKKKKKKKNTNLKKKKKNTTQM